MVREIITKNTKSKSLYEKCRNFLAENGNEIVIGIGTALMLLNMSYGLFKYDLTNITMGFIIYLLVDQRLANIDLFSFSDALENEEEKTDN